MEKFKITNIIKKELARKVKSNLVAQIESNAKSIYYGEFAIMYNEHGEKFYITSTLNIEGMESAGDCLYKIITFDHEEMKKVTLKEIENKIFG